MEPPSVSRGKARRGTLIHVGRLKPVSPRYRGPRSMTPGDDPRFDDTYVERCSDPAAGHDVTLVGVVHDHPASKYRVRTVLADVDPDTLALELPPISVGLFEQYATDERTPPPFGGEMSAAIQAARTDAVVGIDGPSTGFLAQMARRLLAERPSVPIVRKVIGSVSAVSKHALVCRVAAGLAARTTVRLEVDSPVVHDCDWGDDPADQADDERRQIRQSKALMSALGPSSASRASEFRNATREEHMADRLSDLRGDGDVVAVVGMDHLEPLTELLSGTER